MDKRYIYEAETEAIRFLKRVSEFKNRLEDDGNFAVFHPITGYKEPSAIKRASLDLSRALSRMRGAR